MKASVKLSEDLSVFTEVDVESGRILGVRRCSKEQLDFYLDRFKDTVCYVPEEPPHGCLFCAQKDGQWVFDVDRLPDMPEPECAWETSRWVTLSEQRVRHNTQLQARIDIAERAQPRAMRQLEIARVRPTSVQDLKDAVSRLEQIEFAVAALRAQWWHADLPAPPLANIKN